MGSATAEFRPGPFRVEKPTQAFDSVLCSSVRVAENPIRLLASHLCRQNSSTPLTPDTAKRCPNNLGPIRAERSQPFGFGCRCGL